MKNRIVFLRTILMVWSLALYGQAVYYVSPSGDDAQAGDSLHPWHSIQTGLNRLEQGDVLVLLGGTYREKISIPQDSVSLRAATGAHVVLDASGLIQTEPVIEITGKSHIRISGLEIANNIMNDAVGIRVSGSGEAITIENCIIHDIHFSADPDAQVTEQTNAQGIVVYGTESQAYENIVIRNCELYHCRLGYSEGIAINGNVDGFEISGNRVHDLTNIGIDVIGYEGTCPDVQSDYARNGRIVDNEVINCRASYDTSAGIYVDGGANVLIMRNLCKGNGWGIEVGCENPGHESTQIEVRDNMIIENSETGVALGGYDYPSGSGKVTQTRIVNNTFLNNDTQNTGTGSLFLTYSEDCIIENNIFYTQNDDLLYAEGTAVNLILDYNLYYDADGDDTDNGIDFFGTSYDGFSDFQSRTSYEIHGLYASPLWQINVEGIPHLTAQSPAVDTGSDSVGILTGETDFFGNERFFNNHIDRGAEEYGAPDGIKKSYLSLPVYPVPAGNELHIESMETGFYLIFSSDGQLLRSGMIKSGRVDTGRLSKGVYFLVAKSGERIFRAKFIKK